MTHRRWLIVLALVALAALAVRVPRLAMRPVHGDEAIHFEKFWHIHETGKYAYDTVDYHGPTLNYLTFPVVWLTQPADFAHTNEATYRIVTVFVGAALILLLALIADGIGWPAAIIAGLLTAISPAMVFYSRYYIQEMLLVFFSLLTIAAAWRYVRGGGLGWAILCGVGIGLMHATKETWVIAGACMGFAALAAALWTRIVEPRDRDDAVVAARLAQGTPPEAPAAPPAPSTGRRILLGAGLALVAAAAVAFILLSGFFTNLRGPLDSVLAYKSYFARGTGQSDHNNPWDFYLRILLAWRYPADKPVQVDLQAWLLGMWNELCLVFTGWDRAGKSLGAHLTDWWVRQNKASPPTFSAFYIVVLAAIGAIVALLPTRRTAEPAAVAGPWRWDKYLGRFLLFYTVPMAVIYSAISYKTPWCMLGFLHGLILLAAIGAATLIRRIPTVPLKVVMVLILLPGAVHLGWQSWRMNYGKDRYGQPMAASDRFNPHVYGHPSTKMFEIVKRIRELQRVMPGGKPIQVRVVTLDAWPLPWYLRDLPRTQIGYWPNANAVPTDALMADVILTDADEDVAVHNRMDRAYVSEYYGLRYGVIMTMYVRPELWDALVGPSK